MEKVWAAAMMPLPSRILSIRLTFHGRYGSGKPPVSEGCKRSKRLFSTLMLVSQRVLYLCFGDLMHSQFPLPSNIL